MAANIFSSIPSVLADFEMGDQPDQGEQADQATLLGKIKNNFQEVIEVKTSYKSFFIVFFIGLFFILLSMLFLPLIAFSPQKFLSLFSLGSLIIILSFIFMYGTTEYFNMLFKRERLIYSFVYFLALTLGIYSAYVKDSYILSLVSVALQFITVIIFCLSFIPGGSTGISFILSILKSPFKS
jgi:hypothetical protein